MIVIIPKDETRFWRIYFRFMLPIGVLALFFCGFGIFRVQTGEGPAKMDPVLYRTWGTTICIAAFLMLTFVGPLVLTFTVLIWRWLCGLFRKQV